MRPSVRTAYWRKEAVLSRSSIVYTLCLQRPEAVQNVRAEVGNRTTLAANGPPATVALNVVGLLGHTGSGPGGQEKSEPHGQQPTLVAISSKASTAPVAQI